jgi:hypothetical protein
LTRITRTFLAIGISSFLASSAVAQLTRNTGEIISHTEGVAVYADTDSVTTTLQLTTDRPWVFGGDLQLGTSSFHVFADRGEFISGAGALMDGPRLGAARVTATNLQVSTFVAFKARDGRRLTGYEIPLLTHRIGTYSSVSEIRLLTNPRSGSFSTSLLLFNLGEKPVYLTAIVYDDEKPNEPTREYITTDPSGALTWYDIQTRFESGRLELVPGFVGLPWGEGDPNAEVYGFAAIGNSSGDAPRVRLIEPKRGLGVALP